jgi:serine/threonine protein phosphatase 1
LDYIGRLDLPGVDFSPLLGNHDMYLYTFLHDPNCDFDFVEFWMGEGGRTTLMELHIDYEEFYRGGVSEVRSKALNGFPEVALKTLNTLQPAERIGRYVFAHAGIDPDHGFDGAKIEELTTIREPFLSPANWGHDFAVVHGHTICGPEVKPHRIAVDTGVFRTGVLTCAHLQADKVRFIPAAQGARVEILDQLRGQRRFVRC